VNEPETEAARGEIARACAVGLRLRMPMVVDGIDNAVASAYGGWPDRLYLIDRSGSIAYQGGEGPFGFKPAELERAIERELAKGA
jgi:iodothyronine deiodinase-like protein